MHIDTSSKTYDEMRAVFHWSIPDRFNIGVACTDRVATKTPNAPAIIDVEGDTVRTASFGDLNKLSNRVANALVALGVGRGDKVAIMAPQSIETAATHLGIYKAGAIAVPMAVQFGTDAIAYRLGRSGAQLLVCERNVLSRLAQLDLSQTALAAVIVTDASTDGGLKIPTWSFSGLVEKARDDFRAVDTGKDDPAMMLFTSGTTGQPKAALHAHRVLAGHLPGIQLSQSFMPQPDDLLWTPSDWAWAGGLLNALLPALYLGVPIVAARTPRFDPAWAFALIKTHSLANIFMPATALRLMLAEGQALPKTVRSIGSAGEPLGESTLESGHTAWGIRIDEFYGQTECNTVLGSSARLGTARPGSMGKPTPGHNVVIIDESGNVLPRGATGQIAIERPDPVMFMHYVEDEPATVAKFKGEWLLTGDQAQVDDDGFFHFLGRDDDIITSSGYRIGPSEIEDVLTAHPSVKLAAVVGETDPLRTERVVAYIVLKDTVVADDKLALELQAHVRSKLSAHQYPRDIHFVEDIPVTESGKIIRRHLRNTAGA